MNNYISEEEMNSLASSTEPLNLVTPLSTPSLEKRPPIEVKFTQQHFNIPDAKKTNGLF